MKLPKLRLSRLAVAFVIAIAVYIGWYSRQPMDLMSWLTPSQSEPLTLVGQTVSPEQLARIVPQWRNQTTILEFTSPLCKDCQRMKPDLEQLARQQPSTMQTVIVDVGKPNGAVQQQLLDQFQPFVTPTLLRISPALKVEQTLIGYQNLDSLKQLYEAPVPVDN